MQYTRDSSGTVEVDGEIYEWEIRRQPRPVGRHWEGVGIALRLKDHQREAVVQFPMPLRPSGRPDLEKKSISLDAIRNSVTAAIEAGWNPYSRGKVVQFDVDENGF
ncbi:hypothetical protein [Brevundimonas vesicularis]|uniref:hypothetical protein n=1 Tax=Brevundimonas vesicularis TaxID=41276 RepID=UPI0038D3BA33